MERAGIELSTLCLLNRDDYQLSYNQHNELSWKFNSIFDSQIASPVSISPAENGLILILEKIFNFYIFWNTVVLALALSNKFNPPPHFSAVTKFVSSSSLKLPTNSRGGH